MITLIRIGFSVCVCSALKEVLMFNSVVFQNDFVDSGSFNILPPSSTSSNHTTVTSSAKTRINNVDICFVTAEFSESIQLADQVPLLADPTMMRNPTRNFIFTNLPNYSTPQGWERIVLSDLPYKRMITMSRWPKFLGWQHPRLAGKCQIIFYGDAYLLNPQNESAWQCMAQLILDSEVGLMQNKQMGSNHKPVKGPGVELRKNARIGKVSWESANITIQWLKNQSDYQLGIPVYKNAIFGYDPSTSKFQSFVNDFWKEYSKEIGSWRDQPYWAYFLFKHHMTPIKFPFDPLPLGEQGQRGHNDHIYVKPMQRNGI